MSLRRYLFVFLTSILAMSNADSADAQLQPLATMLISSEAHTYSGDGDATLPYRFVRPPQVEIDKK